MECLGCRIANHNEPEVNVVFEDDHITCVLDIAPFNEGHILILPKEHFHDLEELKQDTLTAIMGGAIRMTNIIKKIYKPDGISICQNGGIFNDLTHFHMHVIPRYKGDGFTWSEPLIEHRAETRLKETRSKFNGEIVKLTQRYF
ncbi:HIT family protein [Paenibacillus sp. IHBB 10380]|uniref:HIT family protein n=1 Tax=Paenibacillus sp. IHBB 10380 TaxID=1566358 RepID=UPI0005CFE73F|nr:HIT family protein [Paenibacillus sp. IHBB 10380]AJS58864.1 HIT family hydrolase [Paenibacillus sp. IHBB 10380]